MYQLCKSKQTRDYRIYAITKFLIITCSKFMKQNGLYAVCKNDKFVMV